jgi:hypothetical protein
MLRLVVKHQSLANAPGTPVALAMSIVPAVMEQIMPTPKTEDPEWLALLLLFVAKPYLLHAPATLLPVEQERTHTPLIVPPRT